MTTISDKSDLLKIFDVENIETAFNQISNQTDTGIIYLKINDLPTERNDLYCESSRDSTNFPYQLSYQLPSIELLLKNGSSSVDFDAYKAQSSIFNYPGRLHGSSSSTLSSKLSVTKESIDYKSIQVSSIEDANNILTSSQSSSLSPPWSSLSIEGSTPTISNSLSSINEQFTNYRNISNNDYFDYNEDDEVGDIGNHISVNVAKKVEINNNNHYNFHQLCLTNRFNNHHYHHLHAHHHHHHYYHHHQYVNLPNVLSKIENIPNSTVTSSSLSPPLLPSATVKTKPFSFVVTSTRKGSTNRQDRKTKTKTWKKYSKKKNMSQDELERKRDLANQQERTRMHRLNNALKHLRNAIPYEFSRHPPEKNLSKIKTLRIAIEYIRELNSLLTNDS